jgi:alginate O-acetyltransferase complex protein AlgJ
MHREPPIVAVGAVVLPPTRHGGPTDPSHDDRLKRGIIDTKVSRAVCFVMTALFLLMIYGVPVSQVALEKTTGDDVTFLELFRHVPTKERLRQFEDDLEEASRAKEFVQPRLQWLLTRAGRVGNKLAVVGRRGFLYYRPGISFLAGPGFLEQDILRTRQKAALDSGDPPLEPDPRPAIVAFSRALAARHIKLVVFPVPDKAMLQPLELHGRGERDAMPVPRNPDWGRFTEEMAAEGVTIFDPSPAVLLRGEPPRFLVQDTHWTPQWMQEVAAELAIVVTRTANLQPASPKPVLREEPQGVERLGDIADMLKLPDGQTLFLPQHVSILQIQDETGTPWESDPSADVLLLGDSFTNVFSLDPMGWGVSAGLAPQLARALGRRVDVLAQNDSGAFASRQLLVQALRAGEDRLAGKKVVIWEFASRELAVGDWKKIDWPAPGDDGKLK